MAGSQRSGIDHQGAGFGHPTEAVEEVLSTLVIPKDAPPFDPPRNEPVQGAGSIEARVPSHERSLAQFDL